MYANATSTRTTEVEARAKIRTVEARAEIRRVVPATSWPSPNFRFLEAELSVREMPSWLCVRETDITWA
jgi:hypothetical protein